MICSAIAASAFLTLYESQRENELNFFHNAAVLKHLYRFICDYELEIGAFAIQDAEKVAFSPAPSTRSVSATRPSPAKSATWAARSIWRSTSSAGPKDAAASAAPQDHEHVRI